MCKILNSTSPIEYSSRESPEGEIPAYLVTESLFKFMKSQILLFQTPVPAERPTPLVWVAI